MKKALILLTFIFLAATALYSAENSTVKPKNTKLFTFSQTNLNSQGSFTSNALTKYKSDNWNKFVSKLESKSDVFFGLALGFSIGAGVALTLGVTGSILWGVGWYYYGWRGGPLWAGWVLTGIGWGLFPLLLTAAIVFWVFYAIPFFNKKRSSMRLEPVERGIAIAWKL